MWARFASTLDLWKPPQRSDRRLIVIFLDLSIVGTAIALALMTGLKRRELLFMCVTPLIVTENWLWARHDYLEVETKAAVAPGPLAPH